MKTIIITLISLFPLVLFAQVPKAGSLMGLQSVTSEERDSIVGAAEGMVLYDKKEETIFVYSDTSGWQMMQVGPSVYVGAFVIDTAGVKTISGLPFEPSQITFTAHANVEDFNIDSDNAVGNNTRGLQNMHGAMRGFARNDDTTTVQQVIYIGANGNSVNDIARFASSSNCIGIRYCDTNGADLGKIFANLSSFNTDGFDIDVTYVNGTLTVNGTNGVNTIHPTDVLDESILVLYTAYR